MSPDRPTRTTEADELRESLAETIQNLETVASEMGMILARARAHLARIDAECLGKPD